MDITITESTVKGTAQAPPSKSYTHRAVLAAGYADGAVVHDPLVSADTKATMRAVEPTAGASHWLKTSRRSKSRASTAGRRRRTT